MNQPMNTEEIILRLRQGDPIGLAKAITLVENRRRDYRKILDAIYPLPPGVFKLGLTGAPGSGKSTLLDRLISRLSQRKTRIGVLAIDPSSPISGGALLGDRIRMIGHSTDPNVFIRSMASRGYLGGLSAAAFETIDLMAAAGKELILIETVGVGQSEIDVVSIADLVLTVITPASGDEIQMFKAGLIEITDLFVVNKADLGGADTKVREIESYFSGTDRPPPIVIVSAKSDEGMERLVEAVDSMRSQRQDILERRRRLLSRDLIIKIVQDRVREQIEKRADLQRLITQGEQHNIYLAAQEIFQGLCQGGTDDSRD